MCGSRTLSHCLLLVSLILLLAFFTALRKGVPVATVQLRFDGWVTELADQKRARDVSGNFG